MFPFAVGWIVSSVACGSGDCRKSVWSFLCSFAGMSVAAILMFPSGLTVQVLPVDSRGELCHLEVHG